MSEVITDKLTGRATAGNVTITSEGGAATMQLQQGVAKSWINFNGTGTIAARDSFNNSSLTDNATGDYTTTFTNAMDNANFSANSFAGTGSVTAQTSSQSLQGISTTTIRTLSYVSGAFDRAYTMNQTFGDLA